MRSTFAVLSANVEHSRFQNITLVNAAASSRTGILFMDMPVDSRTGLDNPYQAQVCADGEFSILGLSIDGMELDGPIKLVKIDAEGHEIDVLRGMERLLDRLGPALIVEGDDSQVEAFLTSRRYTFSVMPDSWNRIYERQR